MFVLGLDLAQKKDYTALAALELTTRAGENHYLLHALERLEQRMAYPDQVAHVGHRITDSPQLRGSLLAVDQTGVGQAVVDLFRAAALPVALYAIQITSGHAATRADDGSLHVPKKELVATLSVLLESGRLRMVPGLRWEPTLKVELLKFTAKITTAGNETFGAWRESDHDDLVLAVALAGWLGERLGGNQEISQAVSGGDGRSAFETPPSGVFASEEGGRRDSQGRMRMRGHR